MKARLQTAIVHAMGNALGNAMEENTEQHFYPGSLVDLVAADFSDMPLVVLRVLARRLLHTYFGPVTPAEIEESLRPLHDEWPFSAMHERTAEAVLLAYMEYVEDRRRAQEEEFCKAGGGG